MIRRAIIQNFRCLKNVDITFEPLTVFVGANASGKSTLLHALQRDPTEPDRWRRDPNLVVLVRLFSDSQPPDYTCRLSQGPRREGSRPAAQLIHLDLGSLRQPQVVRECYQIGERGESLVPMLATLSRKRQDAVAHELAALVPMYQDIGVRPLPSANAIDNRGHQRVIFQDRWSPEVWYEPAEVSDGTILLLTFVLLQYQSPSPDVVLIEEPERGLHPFLLGELIKLLRKLATGGLGPRPVQVVLATHSADLLQFVEPKEVRFLSRDPSTGDVVVEEAPHQTADWAKALKEYQGSLGRLWLSGGIGGVPG